MEFVSGVGAQAVEPQPPLPHQFRIDIAYLNVPGEVDQPGKVVVVVGNCLLRAVLLDFQILQKVGLGLGK